MKKWYIIILWMAGLASCLDEPVKSPVESGYLHLSLAVEGNGKLDNYVQSLSVYAFQQNTNGEYVFYKKIAELSKDEISELADGNSDENHTLAKLLRIELPIGWYRFYFVGNADVEVDREPEPGVTLASSFYILYPDTGLYDSYFLGETAAEVGGVADISVILRRTVSRLFMKIEDIPSQIDSVYVSLKNVAGSITIAGSLGDDTVSIDCVYLVKRENVYSTYTLLVDLMSFPTLKGEGRLDLTFLSLSGERRTKIIDVNLQPDKYLYLSAKINREDNSLLSFDVLLTLFFGWDWRTINGQDFVLDPLITE